MDSEESISARDRRGSALGALYRWQSEKRRNLENFCTEALATAIASEPRRFLRLLETRKMMPPGVRIDDVASIDVNTQELTADGKLVDLALEFVLRGEMEEPARAGLWVEVKIGTGLAADQLENYEREMRRRGYHAHRLLVLSRRAEGCPEHNLRWQCIRGIADNTASPQWRDLRAFLEKQSVADNYDEKLDPELFQAAAQSHRLMRQVARRLHHLGQRFSKPDDGGIPRPRGFPIGERKIREQVARSFREGNGFMIGGKKLGPRIRVGIRMGDQGNLDAIVMVKVRRSHSASLAKIRACTVRVEGLRRFDSGALHAFGWTTPLSDLDAEDALTDWWFARLKQLAECGALGICGGNGPKEVEPSSTEASDLDP